MICILCIFFEGLRLRPRRTAGNKVCSQVQGPCTHRGGLEVSGRVHLAIWKARNSQPCEDSDAPNCEVYDSVLTHVLGQVDRNILFCAPACTESAISMSIRIFPAVSATPVSIRPVCSRALALHSGFLFLLCCLRSHAVEFVLGPE